MILVILIFMPSTNLANDFQTGPGLIILVRQGTTEPVGYSQHWNWKEDLGNSNQDMVWVRSESVKDKMTIDHLALLDIWRA